jgi:hypothetical protein
VLYAGNDVLYVGPGGDNALGPRQLQGVVGIVICRHELGERQTPEDAIIRQQEVYHIEDDAFRE